MVTKFAAKKRLEMLKEHEEELLNLVEELLEDDTNYTYYHPYDEATTCSGCGKYIETKEQTEIAHRENCVIKKLMDLVNKINEENK